MLARTQAAWAVLLLGCAPGSPDSALAPNSAKTVLADTSSEEAPLPLGPEVPTSFRSPNLAAASIPDMHLVAWTHSSGPTGGSAFASRVAQDGQVLEPAGTVLGPAVEVLASVASDGTDFAVAWSDRDGQIRISTVYADGNVGVPGGSVVADGSGPSLAHAFDRYVLAWRKNDSVHVAALDPGTLAILSEDLVIQDVAASPWTPRAAGSPGKASVSWTSSAGSSGALFTAMVGPGGVGEPKHLSSSLYGSTSPYDVVWDGERFVFAWVSGTSLSFAATDGESLQKTSFLLPSGAGNWALARGADRTWMAFDAEGVYVVPVSPALDLAESPLQVLPSDTVDAWQVRALTFSGERALLGLSTKSEMWWPAVRLHLSTFDPSSDPPVSHPQRFAVARPAHDNPMSSIDGPGIVTWSELRDDRRVVLAAPLDPSEPSVGEFVEVWEGDPIENGRRVSTSANGHVLTWMAWHPTPLYLDGYVPLGNWLYAVRLDAAGAPLGPPIVVDESSSNHHDFINVVGCEVVTRPEGDLLLWAREHGSDMSAHRVELCTAPYAQDGTVAQPDCREAAAGHLLATKVGERLFVVVDPAGTYWRDYEPVQGIVIEGSQWTEPLALLEKATLATVATDGERALVAARRYAEGGQEVVAVVVDVAGATVGKPTVIPQPETEIETVKAVHDGEFFVVAWTGRHPQGADVSAIRLDALGRKVGDTVRLLDVEEAARLTDLEALGPGSLLLSYERYDDTVGTQRGWVRRVAVPAPEPGEEDARTEDAEVGAGSAADAEQQFASSVGGYHASGGCSTQRRSRSAGAGVLLVALLGGWLSRRRRSPPFTGTTRWP